MKPLEAAADRLVRDLRAVLVIGYGSFAAGTDDPASDLDLAAAVAETRRRVLVAVGPDARDDLLAWARKMLFRAAEPTAEGLHRYHWLVSELPELWCAVAGVPWEGPKKTLARMRRDDPVGLARLQTLWAGKPDSGALGRWLETLRPD